MLRTFILSHDIARQRAIEAVQAAPAGQVVQIKDPTRNLEQNSLLWVYLSEFSKQLKWPVNGDMCVLEPEEWKDILSAAFKQETTRLAAGINGGVVMLGKRTSKFSKKEFAEFIEFILAVAADRGVKL